MRFAILMPWGRVGSNLVVAGLLATKRVDLQNEPTTGLATRAKVHNDISIVDADRMQLEAVQSFFADKPEGFKGLKLSHRSFISPYPIYEALAHLSDRSVLMVRENFLKCAISRERARIRVDQALAKGEKASWAVQAGQSKLAATVMDIDQILRLTAQFEKYHSECLAYADHFLVQGRLTVRYEDLMERPNQKMSEIFSHLGLDDTPVILHSKATADDLRTDVLNYDELERAVAGTEYERFLASC